jgi:hypothetical protein
MASLAPLKRDEAYFVVPTTARPHQLAKFTLNLYADEPGLNLVPESNCVRMIVNGEWRGEQRGGCGEQCCCCCCRCLRRD